MSFPNDTVIDIIRSGTVNAKVSNTLVTSAYDAIAVTYPTDSSESYKFYTGGLAGTLVATVLVTYSDNTKASLSSVVKS